MHNSQFSTFSSSQIYKPHEPVFIDLVDENTPMEFNSHLAVPTPSNRPQNDLTPPTPLGDITNYKNLVTNQFDLIKKYVEWITNINNKFSKIGNIPNNPEASSIFSLLRFYSKIISDLNCSYECTLPSLLVAYEKNNKALTILRQMDKLETAVNDYANRSHQNNIPSYIVALNNHNPNFGNLPLINSLQETSNAIKTEKDFRENLLNHLRKHWALNTISRTLMMNHLIASKGSWSFCFTNTSDLFQACHFIIHLLANSSSEDLPILQKVIIELIQFFPLKIKSSQNKIIDSNTKVKQAKIWFFQEILKNSAELDSQSNLKIVDVIAFCSAFFNLKINEFGIRFQNIKYFKGKYTPRIIPCYLIKRDSNSVSMMPLQAYFNENDSLEKISSDVNSMSRNSLSSFGQLNQSGNTLTISSEQLKTLHQLFPPVDNLISALFLEEDNVSFLTSDTTSDITSDQLFWRFHNMHCLANVENYLFNPTLNQHNSPSQLFIKQSQINDPIKKNQISKQQTITIVPLTPHEIEIEHNLKLKISNQIRENWGKSSDSQALMIKSLIASNGNWSFNFTNISDLFNACDFLIQMIVKASMDDFKVTKHVIFELIQFFRLSINVTVSPQFKLNTKRKKAEHWFFQAVKENAIPADSNASLTIIDSGRVCKSFFALKMNECIIRFQNIEFFKTKKKCSPRIIPCYLLSQNSENISVLPLQAHFNDDNSLTKISQDIENKSKNALSFLGELKFSDETCIISLIQLKNLQQTFRDASQDLISALFIENKHFLSSNSPPTTNPLKRKLDSENASSPSFSINLNPTSKSQINYQALNLEPFYKKQKKFSSNDAEEIVPIDNKNLKSSCETVLSPEKFWEQSNLNSIASVENIVNSRNKRTIDYGTAINYPALNSSTKIANIELVSYYPSLKSYQLNEASKIMNAILNGDSRILAFEMGLGKTLVYITCAHQLFTFTQKASLIISPKSLLIPTKEEFIKYFEIACGEAWRISWLKVIEKSDGSINEYVKALIFVLQKFPNNIAPFLRTIFTISNDHYELFNRSFENHYSKMRSPISFISIKGAVEIHLKSLNASYKNHEEFEFISMEIKKAVKKMQERLPCDEEPMEIDESEETIAKNILFTGNLDEFPVWNKQVNLNKKTPQTILALCEFAGALLEIDPGRILHPLQNYDDTHLQWLREITPEDLIVTCSNENELLNALKSNASSAKLSHKFFITNVDTVQKIPSENFLTYPLSCIIVDEAQKAHTQGTNFNKWLLETSKNKHKETSMLLVSGTPLENNFGEMWNLLAIANSNDAFPSSIHNALKHMYTSVLKLLLDKKDEKKDYLEDILLKSFGQFDNFRKFIVDRFFGRLTMNHPDVIKDWHHLIPRRHDIVIDVLLSQATQAKLTEIEAQQIEIKDKSIFKTDSKILQFLFGIETKSLSLEDDNVKNIISLLKSNNTKEKANYISQAPTLNAFIQNDKLADLIKKREKAIVFTQHRAIAKIIKYSVLHKFGTKHLEIKIYHGKLDELKRNNKIKWFKSITAPSKIIILMEQVGGVGLNLQEANCMFKLFKDYNPAVEAQADARLLRVNSEGIKQIISFQHGLLNEARFSAIQLKKQKWIDFFWNENPNDLRSQFNRWSQILSAECYHAILNNTKNISEAKNIVKPINDLLNGFSQDITNNQLEDVLNALTPKSNAITPQGEVKKQIAPLNFKEDTQSVRTENTQISQPQLQTVTPPKFQREQEKLPVSHWFVLPVPLMNKSDLTSCYFALKTVDKGLLIRCERWLKNDPSWANIAHLGINELIRKTPFGAMNPFVELYKLILNKNHQSRVECKFEIYGFNNTTQEFKKMASTHTNSNEVIKICEYKDADKTYRDFILPK